MIWEGPGLGNSMAYCTWAKSPSGTVGGGLVVDAHLKSCQVPIHRFDGALVLDGVSGCVDVFLDHVPPVQHLGHVLAMVKFILDHLVGQFEAGIGDFGYRQLLMVGHLS